MARNTFHRNFGLALRAIKDLKEEMKAKGERFIRSGAFKEYVKKKVSEYTNGNYTLSTAAITTYMPILEVIKVIRRPTVGLVEIIMDKEFTEEEIKKLESLKERKIPSRWKENYELIKQYVLEHRDELDNILLREFCSRLALLIGSSPITVEWQYVNTLILEGIIEVIHEKGTKLPAIVRIKAQQPSVSQPTSTIQPAIVRIKVSQFLEENVKSLQSLIENVNLSGYAIFIHNPTEEILKMSIDITSIPKEAYFNFIEKLQEILFKMDLAYASNPNKVKKRRSIIVKNIRHKDVRKRILVLNPFPSSVTSTLKNLRADIAEFLSTIGIKLEISSELKKVIYLSPQSKLEQLAKKIEEWNSLIDKLRKKINSVAESKYFLEITNLLNKFNIKMEKRIPNLHNIMIDIYPITITLKISQDIPETLRNIIIITRKLYLINVLRKIYEEVKNELKLRKPNEERINGLIQLTEEFGFNSIAKELKENLSSEDIINFLEARIKTLNELTKQLGIE
jgi:hypothetical protein